jgi:hypothetical protein
LTEIVGLHPFAGGLPYPWERPEAIALYDALSRDVTTNNEIVMLVQAAAPGAPALNLGQPPGAIWREALVTVSLAGGLLDLCRRLADDGGRVALARAAQAMLDAKPAVRRRMGEGGRLVVDRDQLRGYVEELALEGSLVKVLLVRGDPRSGKSWSRLLFERAARDRGAEVVYLRRGMAPTVGLAVRKLFAVLGVPEPVAEGDTTDGAWFQEVCIQLLLAARSQQRRLWIAVDDLGYGPDGASLMDDDIRAFFQQLALNLEDPATHQWFRLLLINYPDGEVPTGWDDNVWKEDRTRPAEITADHVAEVLREWLADHGLTLLDDHLVARAEAVVARADEPVPAGDPRELHPRVRRIHDEVKIELAELAKGPA